MKTHHAIALMFINTRQNLNEEKTIIILESCFIKFVSVMEVEIEDNHRNVCSFIRGAAHLQAAVGEAKNIFLLSGPSTGLE